jgi:4-hydroxy-tetrahydrodipicolinate synthase
MEVIMKTGFYTALGTPFDENGNFVAHSFKKQVRDQVDAGAAGLLAMGSMGIEPCIKQSEYVKIAAAAVEAARGACPVFVGVMDNSAGRVLERVASLKGLKIDGVVATTPFYFNCSQEELKSFFTAIAIASPYPLYLYDLPLITKVKISVATVKDLMRQGLVKGIKTGDIVTARELTRCKDRQADFSIFFSGLDIFDIAYLYGIRMNLDGMFSCTANTAAEMYAHLEKGRSEAASVCLDQILALRDLFVETGVLSGFTYAMNLLGYEGRFTPDYGYRRDESGFAGIKDWMEQNGML